MSDAAPAPPARRVALVVGCGAYEHARRLEAPRGDAAAMIAALEGMGFEVVTGFDCDFNDLRRRLRDFRDRLRGAALGLFYFSGHGAADTAGENHLLPIDAQIHEREDLGRVTVPLDRVMAAMAEEVPVSLLFLDACRDDPFAGQPEGERTKAVLASRPGFVAPAQDTLRQMLIAFATDEGRTARDGDRGTRSPFTAALLRHLPRQGAPLHEVLRDVRREVMEATGGAQVPWSKDGLIEEVVLHPLPGAATQRRGPPAGQRPAPQEPADPPPPPRPRWPAMAAAGVVAAGLAVGGYWVTRGDENANGTGDTVVPIPRPTTGDGLAARVPELGRDPAAGRDIAAALAGTDLSVSEKRKIAAALVAQAAPSRLGAMPAAGRMAVLARLGDIDAVLWLDPTWRRELEAAHRTLAALAATASRDSALLDGTMQAVLRRWQDGAGYVPRISYVVYVQTWGLDERQRDRLRRALVEGWGFNAPETQSYSHAARLAEVRYGGPAMRASAELLAAALNGQTTAQGEAAQARRIAEALKPLVRRRVKAVENELIAEGTVELWLDGSDPSRIETPTGPVIRAPTPGTTRLVP